eukprot:CAMPEP_0117657044 /NCGR_PEP_ID=MMETSP0804-20121206/5123_1 /TAXON_ID=1074897 /ORGANISM="Tetraselmis astigmatica, Strain CCMP880" /LENGTH=252 /DNA_ID=CAMNT_0005463477 /DNA_START=98 /DNA_END=857 /DNA_ORIENTATION=+
MGAQNSSFRRCITDEYQRLKKDGRDCLVLEELVQLKLPRSQWSINVKNLGVMFVLDKWVEAPGYQPSSQTPSNSFLVSDRTAPLLHRNKDGRFTQDELQAFYDLACERAKLYQPYEFMSMIHGYCTLRMWRAVSGAGGHKEFADWVCKLVTESMETCSFPQYPGIVYVHRDPIETLHHSMGIKESQGLDFQSFFDLLQQVAEEKKILALDNEEFDDYLPLAVLSEFALSMITGMQKVIEDIYPANEVQKLDL